MRARSRDEEDTDEADEEDDDHDEEEEEIVYEDPPPQPRNDATVPPVHEGALSGPADVEAWKKLWFHDFKHAFNKYYDYATL
ncbi:hypothetical protein LINPERHAP1_LOCUS24868, partial [Linum perenne]